MNRLNQIENTFFKQSDLDPDTCLEGLRLLNQKNIDFADLFFQRSVNESFALEEGIVKGGAFDISQGVGVRAVQGAKTGFAYSEVLDKKSLLEACLTARSLSIQENSKPLDPKLRSLELKALYSSKDPILSLSRESKVKTLEQIDKLCRTRDPRVIMVMASLHASHDTTLIYQNDGSCAYDLKPTVHLSVRVVMQHNGRTEIGTSSAGGAILLDELINPTQIEYLANEAVRSGAVNLEAIAAPAGTMNVVLGAGWPGVLVHEAVGHGLEGDFIRKGSSTFTGRIGQKVASEHCTIIDDGTIPKRRGSSTCDDEGTASAQNVLIEKGILKGFMYDKQNALLMKTKPTGNGRRESYACLPMPRMTNTYMQPGEFSKDEIISSVKKGIYAVNFKGGQVDITSGNFVFSTSEAYLIEDGKITTPIKGATLIGNGPQTMQQVSMVGNDLEFDRGIGNCGKAGQSVAVGIGQPTVRLDAITVGGTDL